MTDSRTQIDDVRSLHEVLHKAKALLLDFDGPLCSVFAGVPANRAAGDLKALLATTTQADIPPALELSDDPFDVLHYANTLTTEVARLIEATLTSHEVEAISVTQPTPYSIEFVSRSSRIGKLLAVVSNNSTSAVSAYLNRFGLAQFFSGTFARSFDNATLLKPNPFLLTQAITSLDVRPEDCIMIGDSSTDLIAAQAAGIRAIAYANKPSKLARLREHQSAGIITTMSTLLTSWDT
ncbi:HAD family hydrolase [Saccharothrix sp. 6-C]|uniref:HAD family hydrolase n=1 Tax=Saccharothrix sp. 6-C TaxID=2781735 RepID=UPI001917A035|nr:HAD-IA family hydrolase [Saccharothrix sp. 6-C]QQQ76350.1 HAD family hydrolase [Saccharothrix sp. 6-C]